MGKPTRQRLNACPRIPSNLKSLPRQRGNRSMQPSNYRRGAFSGTLIVAALAIGLNWIATAQADQFPADPVENLRKTLENPFQLPKGDPDLMKRLDNAKL